MEHLSCFLNRCEDSPAGGGERGKSVLSIEIAETLFAANARVRRLRAYSQDSSHDCIFNEAEAVHEILSWMMEGNTLDLSI